VNVFRKGDDFIVIAEIPGVKKSDLDVQVKGRTLRLSGVKSVAYPRFFFLSARPLEVHSLDEPRPSRLFRVYPSGTARRDGNRVPIGLISQFQDAISGVV
jgi:hypothetical protein